MGPTQSAAPGGSTVFTDTFFVGPKLQDQLAEVADGLKLTVDYGFLTMVSGPLFWLLNKIHDFVGNWGWSIIFLTIFIKLLLYKLNEKSGRSMAKMKKLQPRLKAIQERYKDDRQKLNEAMMDLYKRYKINPLGGCLPIAAQIPIFFALYSALLGAIELRHSPFYWWITDLSSMDPLYITPLLMGGSMFFQQRLTPTTMDPTQQRILMWMPVVFTAFMFNFPSGLVLYWLTSNTLSILQQLIINRVKIPDLVEQKT